jgi:hypothetical protein
MATWQLTNKGFALDLAHSIDYWQFNTAFVDGSVEGRLQWNSEDGTLEYGLPGGNVTLQIGQEQLVKCVNNTGSTIEDGDVVYVSGAAGSRPEISLASSATGTGNVPIGMATEDIEHLAQGYVNIGGLVRGIDTSGIAAGSVGFLSESVPGALRATPPDAPNYTTVVGYCLFSDADVGIFLVRVLSAPRLVSLSDTLAADPDDGDVYRWVEANDRFELAAIAGGGDLLADGSVPMTANWTFGNYSLTLGGDVVFDGDGLIRSNTADESDSASLVLAGGGAVGTGRGATFTMYGNQVANYGGGFVLQAGNKTGGTNDGDIRFKTGAGVNRMRVFYEGQIAMGSGVDSLNTKMTYGLTLDQGSSDDEILALRSSDVTHGITTIQNTNTFAAFGKASASAGGLKITTMRDDSGTQTLYILAVGGDANTTKGSGASAPIWITAGAKDGTGVQDVGANGNLLIIRNYDTGTRWLVDEDGDTWQSGGAEFNGKTTVYGLQGAGAEFRIVSDEGDDNADFWRMFAYPSGELTIEALTTGSWVQQLYFNATGQLLIGDSANTKMTMGLTINQAANDDEILAFKSSDVAHGYVTGAETDTFGFIRKTNAASGGLAIYSICQDAAVTNNLYFFVTGATASTTRSVAGRSLVEFNVSEHDGADTIANVTADGNVFGIRVRSAGSWLTRWICDEDGDTWQSGSLSLGAVTLSEADLDDLTDGGETALHSHAGGGGGGAAADVTVDDAALDKFLGPFDEETDDLQDLIDYIDETGTEVVQSDSEPETTYPGMVWIDTDAGQAPGIGGNWVLVEEKEFSTEVIDWTISGLDGNTDKELLVKFQMVSAPDGGGEFKMQYNGDTGNNYDYQMHWFGAGHSTGDAEGVAYIRLTADGASNWQENGEIRMPLETGTKRFAFCTTMRQQGGGDDYVHFYTGTWQDDSTNITSVRLFTNNAMTAKFRVYKWQEVRASDIAISGWQLVESKSHDSGALDWTISGLTGDTDKKYKLDIIFFEDLGSGSDLDWRMNGDTGNNYNDSSHWYGGSTGFLNSIGVSSARVTSMNADEEVSGRAEFYVDSSRGGKKSSICHVTRYLGSHWGYVVNGSWDNTADEVTSITFLTNNSVECELKFYRWVD